MSALGDLRVAKSNDTMSDRRFLGMLVRPAGVLKRLTRMLLSGQVLLFPLRLADAMSMLRLIIQLHCLLPILIRLSMHYGVTPLPDLYVHAECRAVSLLRL